MESREIDLLDRHFQRLERCLEPCKLLRYLSQVAVLDEDDVENVKRPNGDRSTRETQVYILLDIMKRRECGLKHFIGALLRSKTQGYLARELLEDEHFTGNEVTTFITESEGELDESQTLKLKLLEQLKKQQNTRNGLLEDQSARSSMVYSDSGYDPDERVEHDDTEIVDYLVRELERERILRQEQRSQQSRLRTSRAKKQGSSLPGLRKDCPLCKSADFLYTLCQGNGDEGCVGPINRSASLNVLNNELLDQEFETGADQEFELEKWASWGDDILNEKSEEATCSEDSSQEQERAQMKELAEKVANLEQELTREKTLRERSEKEVEQLCLEKEELYEELDETRYQLHMSQQDLRFDEEDELRFDEEDEMDYEICITEDEADIHTPERCPEQATNDSNSSWHFPNSRERSSSESPIDCRAFSASKEYYGFSNVRLSNRLKEQSSGMKGLVTNSWINLNVQHYELDNYDSELEVKEDKTSLSLLETLRKLRMRTDSLYEDAVSEGKDLHLLRDRVNRGCNPSKKNMPIRRRNTFSFF